MTEVNLKSVYVSESQANMRYTIYAKRAREEEYSNIARLFTAVTYAEQVNASNHYKNIMSKGGSLTVSSAVFGSRSSSENLQAGIDEEIFEIKEIIPCPRKLLSFKAKKERRSASIGL